MANDDQQNPKSAPIAPEPAPVSVPVVAPVVPPVVPPVASGAAVPSSPVEPPASASEGLLRRLVHAGEIAQYIPEYAAVAFAQGTYDIEQLASGAWRLADEAFRTLLATAAQQHAANRQAASDAFADSLRAIEERQGLFD